LKVTGLKKGRDQATELRRRVLEGREQILLCKRIIIKKKGTKFE